MAFHFRYDYDPEEFAGNQIPLLVVGTKLDQAEGIREKNKKRLSSVAEDFGADQFDLVIFTVLILVMAFASFSLLCSFRYNLASVDI